MTEYARPTERPSVGRFNEFDHIHFYVSNAKQAANYYCTRLGFEPFAYRGLETGSRDVATHVVKQNKIVLAFTNQLNPGDTEMSRELARAGDLVCDIAFNVENATVLYEKAVSRGATSILAPVEEKDEFGTVIRATIQTGFSNTRHSFIQRDSYSGNFLPGYKPSTEADPLLALLPKPNALFIDHCVTNMEDGQMNTACDWYASVLDFHRFWCVDDKQVHTEYSALRSTVMADFDRVIKLPINEPAEGKKKSQIQEYVEYHGGPGIQHIALRTNNVIETVTSLKARGVEFLNVPSAYYSDLRLRLERSPVDVKEDLDDIERLKILVDFDDNGYLLQLFTKPTQDRPTLFYEFIQRANHEGFGAGNFKALFYAIEGDQALRGNLD
jgi:4-hydroxyphenylpyruvate dioxygenase